MQVLLLGECLIGQDRPLLYWLALLMGGDSEGGEGEGGSGDGGGREGGGGEGGGERGGGGEGGAGEGGGEGGLAEAEVAALLQLELACRGHARSEGQLGSATARSTPGGAMHPGREPSRAVEPPMAQREAVVRP